MGLCTMEEIQSAVNALESDMEIHGTIQDFAKFYDQSRTNVSSVINRRMLEKPKRRVSYSFKAFRKIVPKSWGHR